MKQILLVEDDLSLISGLSFAVKKAGYGLNIAHTKSEADEKWEDGKYDLVILDVSLPDGSGFDICRNIRQTWDWTLVEMITSRSRLSLRCSCRESMPCSAGAITSIRRIRNSVPVAFPSSF